MKNYIQKNNEGLLQFSYFLIYDRYEQEKLMLLLDSEDKSLQTPNAESRLDAMLQLV